MVEAGAEEISEDDMLAAMKFGQRPSLPSAGSGRVRRRVGSRSTAPSSRREYPLDQPVEEVQERIFAHYDEMAAALRDADKLPASVRSRL